MASKAKTDRSENIKVYVRYRPLRDSELREGSSVPVPKPVQERREGPRNKQRKAFTFDKVFDPYAKQVDVYEAVVQPLIKDVLQGYSCTVITYGQSGTGKTFTMQGKIITNNVGSWKYDPQEGIIPRTLHQLFEELKEQGAEYTVEFTGLELFDEEFFDLFGRSYDSSKLHLEEDPARKGSWIISDLNEVVVKNMEKVYFMLQRGYLTKKTLDSRKHIVSSHSHTIFSIAVFIQDNIDGGGLRVGKLNFVDLSGSENVGRSVTLVKQAGKAENVNRGISTLARVIASLAEGAPHVPYSESVLTHLLQDSLGGRTKTSIIATVSPASIHMKETLSTLDYARRAKLVTNRPEVNQKLTLEVVRKEALEARLSLQQTMNGLSQEEDARRDSIRSKYLNLVDKIEEMEEEAKEAKELIAKLQEELRETKQRLQESQSELTETRKDSSTADSSTECKENKMASTTKNTENM